MKTLIFDTETTGLPDWKEPSEAPHQPHIVQLAAILFDEELRKIQASMNLVVRPDGWSIPPEVSAVHGIDDELAHSIGVPEFSVIESFLNLVNVADRRAAYNTNFDDRIIRIGLKRFYDDDRAEAYKAGDKFCVMRACSDEVGIGKFPKLTAAYLHFTGKELEGAHDALADAKAALEIHRIMAGLV